MSRKHAWAGGGPENLQTVDLDAPTKMEKTLSESPVNLVELEARTRDELMDVAKELGLSGTGSLRKQELVFRILQASAGPGMFMGHGSNNGEAESKYIIHSRRARPCRR